MPKYNHVSLHPFQYIPCYGLSRNHLLERIQENISIHPMLRFIAALPIHKAGNFLFQYIPCYGLSTCRGSMTELLKISIHPMLRFIIWECIIKITLLGISIHPMLRFITPISHIYINIILISIHPMLRFISLRRTHPELSNQISIHPMLRFISNSRLGMDLTKNYFNTSHVTVYLIRLFVAFVLFSIFQYIPCYGLSLRC